MKTSSRFRARYAESDQMGVVYHTHYLVWCEIGRTDYIRQFGITYAELERQGLLLAVAEAQVRYIASARYDDAICVDTWLEHAHSRLLTFRYEIYRENAEARQLLASAMTKLIAITPDQSPKKLPSDLLQKFKDATFAS